MVFVSVSFRPDCNPTVKELGIGPGVAARVYVSLGGRRFLDRPGRRAPAAARVLELGPVA